MVMLTLPWKSLVIANRQRIYESTKGMNVNVKLTWDNCLFFLSVKRRFKVHESSRQVNDRDLISQIDFLRDN